MLPGNLCLKIISLRHRADRRLDCLSELQRAGVAAGEEAFVDARHTPGFGALGCAYSHGKALADFLFHDNRAFALILEDDFCLRDPAAFVAEVSRCLDHGAHWDVCLLAHNLAVPIEATPLASFMRVVHSQTASAYLVQRAFAPQLVGSFFQAAEFLARYQGLPEPNRGIYKSLVCCDVLWKELQLRHRFLAPFPSLVFQRESWSDIEERQVAYGV